MLWQRNGYLWDPEAEQYEHRLVMERHLGRALTSDEVVHHIDGNRANNSLDNLEVTNRSSHADHHLRSLAPTQVREIRERLASGERGTDLAKTYGVGIATISRVRNRRHGY